MAVGKLYIVATPIGNLGDISVRAVEILKQVNLIVCEDTRVTKKLLNHFEIKTPVASYHHHSSTEVEQNLLNKLLAGESLAYVADAGTPGISDPGGKLVEIVSKTEVPIIPIPGPSAVTAALSIAGFNTQVFIFLGFPPHKKGRQTWFKDLVKLSEVAVFYESTYRIKKALEEIKKIAPEYQLVVCRELTKMFETIYRGTAEEILNQIDKTSSKGEFVVIVNKK